jgi:ribonuclease HII
MGYSVPEHFAALKELGPCVHHRKSFAPVAEKLLAGVPPEDIAELPL